MTDESTPPSAPARPPHDALPHGTRFGEFEIIRVLGVGGFGVVYLANDYSLERQVALKEYMPASLAVRGEGSRITLRSESLAETYAVGLRSFVNEARLLARFDHPSLVKVYRFWEDNGTAYMVMPFLRGMTLRDARRGMARAPDEAWIRSVIDPLLGALEALHREGVYHRDIAPDNILLPPEGAPILLDFGAARQILTMEAARFQPMYTPGFAAPELYGKHSDLGPWTDIYSLGATLYACMAGMPPQEANQREKEDRMGESISRLRATYTNGLVDLVEWCLRLTPSERPQSVFRLQKELRDQSNALGEQSAAAAAANPAGPVTERMNATSRFMTLLRRRDDTATTQSGD
jgi:serine/threonine protein kinase